MTPPLTLLDNQTLVVSASQMEVIRTCAMMWKGRHLFKRVEVVPDAATKGGSAFDSALNHRYLKCGSAPCTPEVEAEMLALVDAAYEGVELPLEEWRTPARYKEVIRAYNQERQQEPFEVLGVQVPFAVTLGYISVDDSFWRRVFKDCQHDFKETPVRICPSESGIVCQKCGGHGWKSDYMRDGVLTYDREVQVVLRGLLDLYVKLAGYNIVVDTKTSKDDIKDGYDNSAQMMSYMDAMQELARLNPACGLPPEVHGAMINGIIVRPPYRSANREAKSSDRPRNSFMRTNIEFYSEERLARHRRDTLAWVEQALNWVAKDHFPQNNRWCNFYQDAAFTNFGFYGKVCPYKDACTAPASQYEAILAGDKFMDYGAGPMGNAADLTNPPKV